MDGHQLKALQGQLEKEKANFNTLRVEASNIQRKISISDINIKDLEKRIAECNVKGEPIVSEHALLRYLERVKGVNIAELTAEILDTNTKKAIEFAGMSKISIKKEVATLIVKNRVVITVE